MLNTIHPKLPMRNKAVTKQFYTEILGFKTNGHDDYNHYLILSKDNIEIHFFLHDSLTPENNYGQVYIRTSNINNLYKTLVDSNVVIHPNGKLESKPWGQTEFSLLDPDLNLLTFGQNQ
ncbi:MULTISPECIES: bleomycin resistance protein [Chryseobacterium]|uniref:bleomycin resistance protein n=1 Tax=Chryseobacterium TaxID=59732 RepID=UPI001625A7F9|nr:MULTISPECIES: VOC family protein [Chryseobacterium]MBF6643949.1 VOC family protein [Chryseobacterium indologenes]MBU3046815.1 VOC family protein [Chryseobacterium indologenes]QQQ72324.1 VOC family protein [Chryseobacterium indologenes]